MPYTTSKKFRLISAGVQEVSRQGQSGEPGSWGRWCCSVPGVFLPPPRHRCYSAHRTPRPQPMASLARPTRHQRRHSQRWYIVRAKRGEREGSQQSSQAFLQPPTGKCPLESLNAPKTFASLIFGSTQYCVQCPVRPQRTCMESI
jgi:hypothetical protein